MKKKIAENIKASEEFKVGSHKIGYVWDSFMNEFGNDIVIPGSILSMQKLTRRMTDSEIINELGVQECTLGDVIATLDGATEEMKDGNWNIFYIKGHSRVVFVRWYAGLGEWCVDDWDRDDVSWDAGDRVFSPATDAGSLGAQLFDTLTLENAIRICKENGLVVTKIY